MKEKIKKTKEVDRNLALTYLYREIAQYKEYVKDTPALVQLKKDKIWGALEFAEYVGILSPDEVHEVKRDLLRV